MLWACLHFPELPFDAVRPPEVAREVAAVITDGPLRNPRIVAANAAARVGGVRIGQSLSAARGVQAGLHAWRRDVDAEQQHLASLADWAYRFSATVSLAPPRSLLVEVGASLSLFGGWPKLERRLRSELDTHGFVHRLAAAPVAAGAQVLAVHHDGLAVLSVPHMMQVMHDIPVSKCGLEKQTSRALNAVGLVRLGAVFAVPRVELARRIGPPALLHLDRLRGLLPEARAAWQPPARYARRFEFDHPVSGLQGLLFPLQRLLREFAVFLVARDGGVQRFDLVFEHERGASTRVPVGLLAPQRDAGMLLELARARLERVEWAAPVVALSLRADDLPALCPPSVDLFDDGRRGALDWPALAERLRARLGEEALQGLDTVADHRPARAWREHALATIGAAGIPARAPGPRPFWLLPREIPLGLPPAEILAGPERIESGWWDGDDQRRDYYIVRTNQGQRAWAFLTVGASPSWMLHGWFA